jgi:hypothetical protein
VKPAGVIAEGNIFEISACVIPPIRKGESGMLTSEVKIIVRIEMMKRRYFMGEWIGNRGSILIFEK